MPRLTAAQLLAVTTNTGRATPGPSQQAEGEGEGKFVRCLCWQPSCPPPFRMTQ